jgi:hypothetical protein
MQLVEPEEKEVWVICSVCEEEHKLFPGINAPTYWCSNELKVLVPGDAIRFEDD